MCWASRPHTPIGNGLRHHSQTPLLHPWSDNPGWASASPLVLPFSCENSLGPPMRTCVMYRFTPAMVYNAELDDPTDDNGTTERRPFLQLMLHCCRVLSHVLCRRPCDMRVRGDSGLRAGADHPRIPRLGVHGGKRALSRCKVAPERALLVVKSHIRWRKGRFRL